MIQMLPPFFQRKRVACRSRQCLLTMDPPTRHATEGRRMVALLASSVSVLLLCVVVGCGGGETTAPPSDASSGADASGESSITPPETDAKSTGAPPPAAGGMQLPDGEIPIQDAQSGEGTSGPAKPGSGIEMPNVTPDANDQSQADSNRDETSIQYASWKEIHAVAKSTGKITVVDLWSTVCEPCVKEFPGLVALHKSMGDQVHCIGVDIDFDGRKTRPPQYYEQRVADFLSQVGADFTNYICSTPSDDVYGSVELDSIPAVLVFDAQGNEVKRFVDAGESIGFGYEKDVIPLVKQLVSQSES